MPHPLINKTCCCDNTQAADSARLSPAQTQSAHPAAASAGPCTHACMHACMQEGVLFPGHTAAPHTHTHTSTMMLVPGTAATGLGPGGSISPSEYLTRKPCCMLAVIVVTVTWATKLMLASASPRKPRVEMVSRSSKARSLLVVCLRGWGFWRRGRQEGCVGVCVGFWPGFCVCAGLAQGGAGACMLMTQP